MCIWWYYYLFFSFNRTFFLFQVKNWFFSGSVYESMSITTRLQAMEGTYLHTFMINMILLWSISLQEIKIFCVKPTGRNNARFNYLGMVRINVNHFVCLASTFYACIWKRCGSSQIMLSPTMKVDEINCSCLYSWNYVR